MTAKILAAVADALRVDPSTLSVTTGIGDVPQWDSVAHVAVVLAVEKACGVTFDIVTQMEVRTVQDLIDAVEDA